MSLTNASGSDTLDDILEFFRDRAGDGSVEPDTDLLDAGLVDSLTLMDLLVHLESRYGLVLPSEDIAPRHFVTPAAIVRLVEDRQAA